MKKILSLALTAVFVTALSIPIAADTPTAASVKVTTPTTVSLTRADAPASMTLSGTVNEVKENEILFTTAEGVKYTVPVVSLKENENYKKMALKAGDQIQVTGSQIMAVKVMEGQPTAVSGSISVLSRPASDTLKIQLNKVELKDAIKSSGTITLSNEKIPFTKADNVYTLADEKGNTMVISTAKPNNAKLDVSKASLITGTSVAEPITLNFGANNVLIPTKISANGFVAEVK